MRTLLTLAVALCFYGINAQGLSYEQFQKEAKINKRLLPKYGNIQKSEDELAADEAFKEKSLQEYPSLEKASKAMVMKGYQQLESDPKEAMYCFNQAYLLDSSNADIYWGYGKLYYHFGQFSIAQENFEEGLAHNPKSTMLLNALGINCIEMYKADGNHQHLEGGIKHLQSSFMVDPKKAETSRILTEVYLHLDNCQKAKKYYQVYLATDKDPKEVDLTMAMETKCNLGKE